MSAEVAWVDGLPLDGAEHEVMVLVVFGEGDSFLVLFLGGPVVIIGNAIGFQNSVSYGAVSGKDRGTLGASIR